MVSAVMLVEAFRLLACLCAELRMERAREGAVEELMVTSMCESVGVRVLLGVEGAEERLRLSRRVQGLAFLLPLRSQLPEVQRRAVAEECRLLRYCWRL